MEVLLEPILNQILQAEMTEHLKAEPGEETDDRRGYRNGFYDATAVLALPKKYRKRLRTTNMLERFIQEIRRREKVIRIYPNMDSAKRLVGALCAETHEDGNPGFPRSTGRRYLTMDEYFEWRTDRSVEDTLNEQTSLNGEPTGQSAAVLAYIEDLAERQLHKIRELMSTYWKYSPPSLLLSSLRTLPERLSSNR
jgi:hypothetical protein